MGGNKPTQKNKEINQTIHNVPHTTNFKHHNSAIVDLLFYCQTSFQNKALECLNTLQFNFCNA